MAKKTEDFSGNPASTAAAQSLLALLQAENAPQLRQAMALAAAGDYEGAQAMLAPLLQEPLSVLLPAPGWQQQRSPRLRKPLQLRLRIHYR